MHSEAKHGGLVFIRRSKNLFGPFFVTGLLIFLCLLIVKVAPVKGGEPAPFFGLALDGHPLTESRLEEVECEIGLKPDLVLFFLQWPAPGDILAGAFPEESLDAIWQRGTVPCLTWEPMYFEDGNEKAVHGSLILDGVYDPYIVSFAERARVWGRPFIIRFAHEMNLGRYHWGTTKEDYGPESPMIYQDIFRYVVDTFNRVGAHNVLWAFCPNAESVPNPLHDPEASWNSAKNYYPGDEYVDILGMDGYNWGSSQTMEKNGWDSHWKGFREIFGNIYCELRRTNSQKPVFVFETSTVHEGGDREKWIKEAAEALRAWRIKGVVWFHVDKEQDWRLQAKETRLLVMRCESQSEALGLREWIQERTKWTGKN